MRLSRVLRNETLERRQLLAGDIAFAHNYWHAADVDNNQEITANDALRVINQLSRNQGSFEVTEAGQIDSYADVNADGWVTASDALLVINSLSRGEAIGDEDIRLDLNARDINDNALTTSDNRSIEVEVDQPFFLEVSYVDGRGVFEQTGAFQIITDVLFRQDGSPAADAITPVLTETQRLVLEDTLRDSDSGTLTFSLEGSSETATVTRDEFLASVTAGPEEIEEALIELGYEQGTFRVARVRDEFGNFAGQPSTPQSEDDPGNLVYEIRYTDLQFSGVDLPDLQVVTDLDNGVRGLTEASPPVNPDSTLNFAAAGDNLDSRSRTFPDNSPNPDPFGNEVYNQFKFGTFDPSFGFDEIGAIGPIASGGIPQFVGSFNQPFDAFSIPVIINRPVTNLNVSLALADNNERVLLYNEDEPVESDKILLNALSQFTITAIGDAENNPPVAVNDTATTPEETPIDIDVLANDSDDDGDPLTVSFGGVSPTRGTVSVNQDGTIRYTPNDGEIGVDTFTYVANDGQADSNEATVTVTITEVNDPPVLDGEVIAAFSEDDPEDSVDLLFGATDPDQDPLSVVDPSLVSGDPAGIDVDLANNRLEVDPNEYNSLALGESAVIVYSYGITDGQGNTIPQTATVTIEGENDPPVANDDEANADGRNPLLIDVLANDFDPDDSDELTLAVGTDPQNGSLRIVGNQIEYTAGENAEFVDTFTYTISDGIAEPVEATVTVNVFEENFPPTVGEPVVASFTEDTGEQTFSLLDGAEDPNGDTLSVVDLQISPDSPLGVTVLNGTVTVDTDAYQFLAQDEVSDPITFTYSVSDGVLSVEQTATLTITGVNDPPVAADDVANTIGTAPVLIDVLANDSDPDGDDLTVAVASDPQFGTAVLVGNQIRYTADANVERTDTFTYTISDGIAAPIEATVTVNVFEENFPPIVGEPVVASFTEDTGEQTFSLLEGVEDPNGDTLSVTDLQISPDSPLGVSVENGTVTVDTDAYQFLAQDEVSDPVSFSYGVSDGEFTVTQTATLTITGVNDAPVAADLEVSTLKNGSVTIDVLARATDPDLIDALSVVEVTDGGNGDVTVNDDGTLSYTPATDFTGVDSFSYTISDGIATSQATVTVTVNDFAPSLISGTIFFDHLENIREVHDGAAPIRNGVKDDDESGLGGAPVLLVSGADENVSGEEIRQVVYTGLHGDYEFENVVPGTYRVIYEIPETISFHQNGDGSSEPGVMEISIGPQGGEDFGDMNFTLINTIGSATGNNDILTQPNPGGNPTADESRKIGLVRLSESGEQEYFRAFYGFESFVFAELTLNESRDAALLSVIDDNGTLLTARVSGDRFVVNENEDGTTVQFYGTGDDFDFTPADSASHSDEFSNYRNAIDKVLGSYGLDD